MDGLHQRRGHSIGCYRRCGAKTDSTSSTACQSPLEKSQSGFCCMSDIYLGSPEWRWICPARIRSNGHVITSMILPGWQNGEFEASRCEGREELPPDPYMIWLRLRHTDTRRPYRLSRYIQICTATVTSVSRRVSGKPPSFNDHHEQAHAMQHMMAYPCRSAPRIIAR